jgi:hypothetical protein
MYTIKAAQDNVNHEVHRCWPFNNSILKCQEIDTGKLLFWLLTKNRQVSVISTNLSLLQKHPGVCDMTGSFEGTLYPIMGTYTLHIVRATSCVAYLFPLLSVRNMMTFMHHQNDTCVTLSTGATIRYSRLHNSLWCLYLAPAECYRLPLFYSYIPHVALSA